MKKLITIFVAVAIMAVGFVACRQASGGASAKLEISDVVIQAVKNTELSGDAIKEITLTITGDSIATENTIAAETTLDWTTNLPAGLNLKVKEAISDNATEIKLKVAGTPTVAATTATPLQITIPADSLKSGKSLKSTNNSNAKFVVTEPQPTVEPKLTIGDVQMTGTYNNSTKAGTFSNTAIVLTLSDAKFSFSEPAGASVNVASWFKRPGDNVNKIIIAGLYAQARSPEGQANTLTIDISGEPFDSTDGDDPIPLYVRVPAAYTTLDADIESEANPNATIKITAI